MLSQIPPQKIYAGAGCSAPLPNYLLKVSASDNCELASLTQTPAAGYILDAANKVANVIIKATDASGNYRQITFTVTLLDTIKPVFTIDPSLLAYQLQQVKDLYNFADRMIWASELNLYKQAWIDSISGLREKLQDSSYMKKTMLIWTSPAYAITGIGSRVFTFYNPDTDTIILRRDP